MNGRSYKLSHTLLALALFAPWANAQAQEAEAQFRKTCMSCHTIGLGVKTGPDLKGVLGRRSRTWAAAFIQSPGAALDKGDPAALQLLKDANNVKMPELGITAAEAEALLTLIDDYTRSGKTLGSLGITRPPTPYDLLRGKMFIEGRARFSKGGPACLSCHTASGVGLLGGGGLGPSLNAATGRYGKGLASAIENPSFPTMQGVFAGHELTPEEAFQVAAFLNTVAGQPAPKKDPFLPVLGLLGFAGGLAAAQHLGRKRFRGVRKNLQPRA